ncbi:acyltransferase family protein [Streptomyces sp. 7N604]|uniref:acyltransferase family protein n=1 Tax=Streptomyces sp. 7N604 TaxID=3457415 RepID=UPI003FCF4110
MKSSQLLPLSNPSTSSPAAAAELPRAAGASPPAGAGRLRELDGLRLLAALMVCLFHYAGRGGAVETAWGSSPRDLFPHLSWAALYGNLGVEIFFAISGFVICMSCWGRTVGAFFRSRVVRLYPAYWAALILVGGVFALAPQVDHPPSVTDFVVNLTMLQQPAGSPRILGVCWTLWAEARFYLLFALFVVWKGTSYRRVVTFCCGWTIATVIAQAAPHPLLGQIVQPTFAPYFITGLALYLIHRYGGDLTLWGIIGVNWALGNAFVIRALADSNGFLPREPLIIAAVLTCGIATLVLVATGRLSWARWRWLTTAGALTYPFYLIHEHLGWASIYLLHQLLGIPPAWTLPLTAASMLALAWGIHRAVERPLGAWMRSTMAAQAARGALRGR